MCHDNDLNVLLSKRTCKLVTTLQTETSRGAESLCFVDDLFKIVQNYPTNKNLENKSIKKFEYLWKKFESHWLISFDCDLN